MNHPFQYHGLSNFFRALPLVLVCSVNGLSQEHKAVPWEIVKELLQDKTYGGDIKIGPDGEATNLVAEEIDLNSDSSPDLYIHGIGSICGANNCITWIYAKLNGNYQRVLEAGVVQSVKTEQTVTKGFKDITASMHYSAMESSLSRYRFNGKSYQLIACFNRLYPLDWKPGDPPEVTPENCVKKTK